MYTAIQRQQVLLLAKDTIAHGLQFCEPMEVEHHSFASTLLEHKATFVTLNIKGKLRGCMGNLVAHETLLDSVASNTFKAAFHDPRFPGLEPEESEQLSIHISVLSDIQAIDADCEQALLEQLVPHVDGVILREGTRSSTFLPDVWEKIPTAEEFIKELKRKAGLPENYWSQSLVCERYSTVSIGK
jgi:AmmeMemoRadiSam system protein A